MSKTVSELDMARTQPPVLNPLGIRQLDLAIIPSGVRPQGLMSSNTDKLYLHSFSSEWGYCAEIGEQFRLIPRIDIEDWVERISGVPELVENSIPVLGPLMGKHMA